MIARIDLADGRSMPQLGFGVYRLAPGRETRVAVEAALAVGYRHVDTAAVYRNEADVGAALRASGLPRDEVFITTKLWNDDQGARTTRPAFEASLAKPAAVSPALRATQLLERVVTPEESQPGVAAPAATFADTAHAAAALFETDFEIAKRSGSPAAIAKPTAKPLAGFSHLMDFIGHPSVRVRQATEHALHFQAGGNHRRAGSGEIG